MSGACSLSCRYCYADGGSYGGTGACSDATALRSVLWAYNTFGSLRHIQFFGGEPTLEPRRIDLTCEFALALSARLPEARRPTFGITTNGMHLTEEVLRVLVRHEIDVTVSIDGPEEIHDRLRRQRNGAPSFARVADGVDRLMDRGMTPEIECTYTGVHLQSSISVSDLLDFFDQRFGSRIVHCATVVSRPGTPFYLPLREAAKGFKDAMRMSLRRVARGKCVLSTAARWIHDIARHKPTPHYCPAGRSSVTVGADGSVFPCFMFLGRPGMSIGNIEARGVAVLPAARRVLDKGTTATDPECQRCWMRPLCFGCIGDDLTRGDGSIDRAAEPGKASGCDFRRALGEGFLEGFAELSEAELTLADQPQPGRL